ncbi:hypothetical protein LCGC14_2404030, partial [marine sediment metagenome]
MIRIIEAKDIFAVSGPTSSGRPFLNENQLGALSTSSTFLADKRTLMNWIKRTSECMGILRQISNDIITRINFTAMEEPKKGGRPVKNLGKNKELEAQNFAKNNFLKQTLKAAVIEGLALGDAYLWKGKISTEEKETMIRKVYKEVGIELKESEVQLKAIDED